MSAVHWKPDARVREGVYAYLLLGDGGEALATVTDSTNTFRKAGDYAVTVWSSVTLSGEGQWPETRSVLICLFPNYNLLYLDLPPRTTPQPLEPDGWR